MSLHRGNIDPDQIQHPDDATLFLRGDAIWATAGGGSGTVTHTGALTADQPVFGNGSADIKVGTKSGNTDEVMSATGSFTSGHVLKSDANGNAVDGGTGVPGRFAVGFSSVTSVTVTHNAGTTDVIVQVQDAGTPPNVIFPANIEMTSTTVVTVTFGGSQSGRVVVLW